MKISREYLLILLPTIIFFVSMPVVLLLSPSSDASTPACVDLSQYKRLDAGMARSNVERILGSHGKPRPVKSDGLDTTEVKTPTGSTVIRGTKARVYPVCVTEKIDRGSVLVEYGPASRLVAAQYTTHGHV